MSEPTRHPAPWNRKALDAAADRLVQVLGERPLRVCDPYAGTGRIHELRSRGFVTVGGELEPEWAQWHEHTTVADALRFPAPDASFDAVCTSPCWGNRMADSHDAQERCSECGGLGVIDVVAAADMSVEALQAGATNEGKRCPKCDGAGRREYTRNTYRHALGRMPTPGSSSVMQFGPSYRRLHRDWLVEAQRLLAPEGVLVVNISNHIRAGREVDVVGWWLGAILGEGFIVRAVDWIPAAKLRHGANRDLRVEGEVNIVAQVRQ